MLYADPVDLRRQLTTLHLALCLGCAAFLAVTAYLGSDGTVPLRPEAPVPGLAAFATAAAALAPVVAMLLFRRRIRALPQGSPFDELALAVRAASILHWAFIEGALFLNLIAFMLQADSLHWGLAAALLVMLVMRAPSERRLQRWLTGTA